MLYESMGVSIEARLAENLPQIYADPAMLRQVLHNLFQNAIDALTGVDNPRILVATSLGTGGVLLTVRDNGTGIAEGVMGRIFEPYVTTKPKGTGPGPRDREEDRRRAPRPHPGRERQAPWRQREHRPAAEGRRESALDDMSANQILVVDDEVGIRELLFEILRDEGYGVRLAENAQTARSARKEMRPDLVLLDIWMPDTDGITLLKEWAGSGLLTMPVVMMSGHGTIDSAVEATRIGAFDFLEKPISLPKLLATVGKALAGGRALPKTGLALVNLGRARVDPGAAPAPRAGEPPAHARAADRRAGLRLRALRAPPAPAQHAVGRRPRTPSGSRPIRSSRSTTRATARSSCPRSRASARPSRRASRSCSASSRSSTCA